MKVFLTGATGYVGRQVVRDLIKSGYAVVALVRKGSEPKLPEGIAGSITVVNGDIRNPESYRDALQSCNAIINLPGLLREFPKRGITFEGVHFLGTKFLVDEAQKIGHHAVHPNERAWCTAGSKAKIPGDEISSRGISQVERIAMD